MFDADVVLRGIYRRPSDRTQKEQAQIREMLKTSSQIQDGYAFAQESNLNLDENDYYDYLACRMVQEYYPKGRAICHKGETTSSLMIVLSGKVAVAHPVGSDDLQKLRNKVDFLFTEATRSSKTPETQEAEFQKAHQAVLNFFGGSKPFSSFCSEFPGWELSQKSILAIASQHRMNYSEGDMMLLKIGKSEEYFEEGVIKYKVNNAIQRGVWLENSESQSTGTYFALESVYIGSLEKEVLTGSFTGSISEEKEKFEFFAQFFPELPQNRLTKVLSLFQRRLFRLNSKIYEAGSPINEIFALAKGSVRILRPVLDNKREEENSFEAGRRSGKQKTMIPVRTLDSERVFGNEDLRETKNHQEHSFTAVSASAFVVAYSISKENYIKSSNLLDSFSKLKGAPHTTQKNGPAPLRVGDKRPKIPSDVPDPPKPFRVDHKSFQETEKFSSKKALQNDIYSVINPNRFSEAFRQEQKRKMEEIQKNCLEEVAASPKHSRIVEQIKRHGVTTKSPKNLGKNSEHFPNSPLKGSASTRNSFLNVFGASQLLKEQSPSAKFQDFSSFLPKHRRNLTAKSPFFQSQQSSFREYDIAIHLPETQKPNLSSLELKKGLQLVCQARFVEPHLLFSARNSPWASPSAGLSRGLSPRQFPFSSEKELEEKGGMNVFCFSSQNGKQNDPKIPDFSSQRTKKGQSKSQVISPSRHNLFRTKSYFHSPKKAAAGEASQ